MTDQRKPKTLVKVGRYNHSLEKTVKLFHKELFQVSMGLGNTIKYAGFEKEKEKYLLMVSQQKDRLISPEGYNVILTVTSYLESRNKRKC